MLRVFCGTLLNKYFVIECLNSNSPFFLKKKCLPVSNKMIDLLNLGNAYVKYYKLIFGQYFKLPLLLWGKKK